MVDSLQALAQVSFKECSRYLLFDETGAVLASSFQPTPEELRLVMALFGDRSAAIKAGMVVQGTRYEVHRHHPPLVYGRTMGVSEPEHSEGGAACHVEHGLGGKACYGVITYQMPNLSARMVPILQAFCRQHLAGAAPPGG